MAYTSLSILNQLTVDFRGVSKNVFYNNRPTATQTVMNEFVVLCSSGTILDKKQYGSTYCDVYVFVKDRDNGSMSNETKIDSMAKDILSRFPLSNDVYYSSSEPQFFPSQSDTLGFHYIRVYFEIIIR